MEDAAVYPLAQLMKTHLKGNILIHLKQILFQPYLSTNTTKHKQSKNTNLNKVAECLEWIGAEKYEQVPLYSARTAKSVEPTYGW